METKPTYLQVGDGFYRISEVFSVRAYENKESYVPWVIRVSRGYDTHVDIVYPTKLARDQDIQAAIERAQAAGLLLG